MRNIIHKRNSTKPERIFAELLKTNHIPFKHRVKIANYEIDFLIGKYAVEINGHPQNTKKNEDLAKLKYIPIHFHNSEINSKLNVNKLSLRS